MPGMSLEAATRLLIQPGGLCEVVEATIAGRTQRVWRHAPVSLRQIVLSMPARAGRDYLVYEDERIEYERAYRMIAALAHALIGEFGIRRGERVALAMRNYPEWALAFWAITSVG